VRSCNYEGFIRIRHFEVFDYRRLKAQMHLCNVTLLFHIIHNILFVISSFRRPVSKQNLAENKRLKRLADGYFLTVMNGTTHKHL
jgi:hypothetical protein